MSLSHRLLLAACLLAPAMALAKQDSITLCFERQDVRPWRTLDGGGLNFELLGEVARRVGVTFDYQSMPWKRCLEQLRANQVGGAFAVSFNRDRLGLGVYPGVPAGAAVTPNAPDPQADPAKRMHIDTYVLVRPKGSRLDWDGKTFHHLEGRIGFQLGYSVGDFLRLQGVALDEGSQRPDELAEKLVAGRLAGAAMGGGDAIRMLRGPMGGKLEVLPVPLVEKPYYLVLSHAFVARQPQLAARLWNAIEEVRNSPGYRQRERDYATAARRKLVDTGVDLPILGGERIAARDGGRH
ncbi:amino acid ABC transporter substrate-binding protein [Massilia sp. G4R7]|uniref:Amino acid ABC transporter substrate-binding protein n=1 Tax=Massilia phyllostachyos TaxID=2898585 RepID=A0ABS8Q3B5_9BURK|nr:amino acid ABC transporter substrate-binding protein [Massilia phyllostachyos]MCD2516233.1 amino acid ABC transporter substrate-binding protein [Massilia phyllostachyos]